MTPDQYCQQKAAASGSSFYYSFRFLPPPRRRAITALYAFCREVDDVVDECADAQVARTTLQWWRREVSALYDGNPSHPVTRALQPALAAHGLEQPRLLDIIDGMDMDLEWNRYPDFPTLEVYCHRVAGVVGMLSASIFGYTDPATLGYARDLGIALQLTNIARDVGEDASMGRVYLPLSWLREAGIDPDAWLRAPEFGPGIAAVVARLLRAADELYRRAEHGIAALPRDCRPAIRAARLVYAEIGREVERHGHDSVTRRAVVARRRKAALMARALSASVLVPAFGAGPGAPLPELSFLVEAVERLDASLPAGVKARLPRRSFDEKMAWMAGLFERLAENDRAARRGVALGKPSFD